MVHGGVVDYTWLVMVHNGVVASSAAEAIIVSVGAVVVAVAWV